MVYVKDKDYVICIKKNGDLFDGGHRFTLQGARSFVTKHTNPNNPHRNFLNKESVEIMTYSEWYNSKYRNATRHRFFKAS